MRFAGARVAREGFPRRGFCLGRLRAARSARRERRPSTLSFFSFASLFFSFFFFQLHVERKRARPFSFSSSTPFSLPPISMSYVKADGKNWVRASSESSPRVSTKLVFFFPGLRLKEKKALPRPSLQDLASRYSAASRPRQRYEHDSRSQNATVGIAALARNLGIKLASIDWSRRRLTLAASLSRSLSLSLSLCSLAHLHLHPNSQKLSTARGGAPGRPEVVHRGERDPPLRKVGLPVGRARQLGAVWQGKKRKKKREREREEESFCLFFFLKKTTTKKDKKLTSLFLPHLQLQVLLLDGKAQSAEADEHVYHEMLVHPALIAHGNPRQVFIAGGGKERRRARS